MSAPLSAKAAVWAIPKRGGDMSVMETAKTLRESADSIRSIPDATDGVLDGKRKMIEECGGLVVDFPNRSYHYWGGTLQMEYNPSTRCFEGPTNSALACSVACRRAARFLELIADVLDIYGNALELSEIGITPMAELELAMEMFEECDVQLKGELLEIKSACDMRASPDTLADVIQAINGWGRCPDKQALEQALTEASSAVPNSKSERKCSDGVLAQ